MVLKDMTEGQVSHFRQRNHSVMVQPQSKLKTEEQSQIYRSTGRSTVVSKLQTTGPASYMHVRRQTQ